MHLRLSPAAVGAGLALLVSCLPAQAQTGGVTLNQYRAAPTANDGFAIGRPVGLGHLALGARLDVDYALEPLRVDGGGSESLLVEHEATGQLGFAIGVFDRFVGSVRLPVVLVMEQGQDRWTGDPVAQAVALGDVALGARWVLFGEESTELFAIALAAEATIPTAEAASTEQDLAGEAGPSFTPEVDAELRFAPVRISAELGLRFREQATYQRLPIGNELTWGLGVGVDIVEDVLDATLEGYGATPLDDFAHARRSPVELLLGARVRPGSGLSVGVAAGAGLGDGYGAPRLRALLNVGWTQDFGARPPREREAPSVAPADPSADADPLERPISPASAGPERPAGTGPAPSPTLDPRYAQLDRDGDRLVDAHDRCPLDREDYDEIQDDDGCPEEDADHDTVVDVVDRCPLTVGVASENPSCNGCPALACVSDEGTITISERVEFATGSDRILDESEAVLTDVLSIISTSDQLRLIRIEGHTDDRDSDQRNIALSRARAASVRRWLAERGIDVARFEAWGCGEAHPIETNRSRAGRQANRRVEFHIIDPPTAGYTPRAGCERAE